MRARAILHGTSDADDLQPHPLSVISPEEKKLKDRAPRGIPADSRDSRFDPRSTLAEDDELQGVNVCRVGDGHVIRDSSVGHFLCKKSEGARCILYLYIY